MIIEYNIVPHRKQRYDTVGDYFYKQSRWHFRISRLKDRRYIVLVFLHEMIEWTLCQLAGIKMKDIDRFDREYERTRHPMGANAPCGCVHLEEPGDDPHAPYHAQHVTATACEQLIANAIGVKWDEYEKAVEAL